MLLASNSKLSAIAGSIGQQLPKSLQARILAASEPIGTRSVESWR
ncbi:hypothetical protein [Microcoleus vaginatus]